MKIIIFSVIVAIQIVGFFIAKDNAIATLKVFSHDWISCNVNWSYFQQEQ